jgi:hypothetical protein
MPVRRLMDIPRLGSIIVVITSIIENFGLIIMTRAVIL